MADLPAAVQASKLMDLVRAGKAYDHENRPRTVSTWTRVPDDQAARIIVGALVRLLSDLGGDEEDGDG